MNRALATTMTIVSTAAAALAFAAIAAAPAYADDITIDTTPFVSTRTRAEVQAEVSGQAEHLRLASDEWSTQMNDSSGVSSALTRAEATREYIAARQEVNARNGEDSGSMYLASTAHRRVDLIVADSDD